MTASELLNSLIRQLNPSKVSHNETSEVAEPGPGGKHHREVTSSLELGSLPPLLSPLTHLLVAFAEQEAKSEPWF